MWVGSFGRLVFSLCLFANVSRILAEQPHPCAEHFGAFAGLKVLTRNLDRVRLPVEVQIGGQLLTKDRIHELVDIFRQRGNGDYLYVLTRDGTLAFGLRHQGSISMDRYLLGHPSLVELLKTQEADPKVVAAGEWVVRNGRLSVINNQSGTFRPGPETLEGMKDFLSASSVSLGRPALQGVHSQGTVKPWSSPIFLAFYDALAQSGEFQSKTRDWAELYGALAQRFPSAEAPGWFDSSAARDFTERLGLGSPSQIYAALKILEDTNREGLGYALFHPLKPVELLDPEVSEKTLRHLKTLDELLKSGWELVSRSAGV